MTLFENNLALNDQIDDLSRENANLKEELNQANSDWEDLQEELENASSEICRLEDELAEAGVKIQFLMDLVCDLVDLVEEVNEHATENAIEARKLMREARGLVP